MEFSDVIENWKQFAEAIEKIGGKIRSFTVDEPATKSEIDNLEEKLGFPLPSSV
jgi:cell wall assembly regulator SMI1